MVAPCTAADGSVVKMGGLLGMGLSDSVTLKDSLVSPIEGGSNR